MDSKDDEIKHIIKQERSRGRTRTPIMDYEEKTRREQLKKDVMELLKNEEDRDRFIEGLGKLTAHYGQQVGSEYRDRALAAYDEYQKQRRR